MQRIRSVALALMLTAAAVGCGGGDDGGTDDEATGPAPSAAPGATSAPVSTTVPGTTVPATSLTLRVTDVRLLNSEESDNGIRVLLPPGVASAQVTLSGVPSPNRVINVCQADQLDRRMTTAVCRTPANGEAVTLPIGTAASGVEIVQVGTSAGGAAGNSTALEEVTVRYTASSREMNVRLPQIAAGDAGGRPTFSLTPASANGAYRAAVTWTVIQVFGGSPSNAQVELVQGGSVANQAQSSAADLRLNGNLSTPGSEAAIRVSNIGASALVTPKLALLLP